MSRSLWIRAGLWAAISVAAAVVPPLPGGTGKGLRGTKLTFTPKSFDFGSVRAGALVKAEFAFENPTDSPIRLTSVHGTCGCVQTQASTLYVEPHARGTIQALILTEGRLGPQNLGINVRTDEGEGSGVRLQLKGTITVALRADLKGNVGRLGLVEPGSEHVFEVPVEKLEPVREVVVQASGEGLSAEKVSEDERGCMIRVRVNVPWKTGTQVAKLRLTGGEGSTVVPVSWTVEKPFQLSAEDLEIRGGKGEIVATPRWPSVKIARVETRGLPLEVAREGDRILFTLKGSALDIPPRATVDLVPEPASLGVVRVHVSARLD